MKSNPLGYLTLMFKNFKITQNIGYINQIFLIRVLGITTSIHLKTNEA